MTRNTNQPRDRAAETPHADQSPAAANETTTAAAADPTHAAEAKFWEDLRASVRETEELQRDRLRRIGEGELRNTFFPPRWTLAQMCEFCLFVRDGSQVAVRQVGGSPLIYSLPDFRNATKQSWIMWIPPGAAAGARQIRRACADLWIEHDLFRRSVHSLTFAPGRAEIVDSPEGHQCLNLWRPILHAAPSNWKKHVAPFLAHVEYLVPIEAEREHFLQWLAHIEQDPGRLPHSHYLMITRRQGIGRNWLASVLAQVWAGHVALGFDLGATLRTGFNGRLSRKLLAVVDELNEGGGSETYRHAETLKTLLTEEHRQINPKYGRQHVEFNCCRFLMFSNHDVALPLSEQDRRVRVVDNPNEPKDANYYKHLYRLVEDPKFTHSVREYLRRVDLSKFNPGEVAPRNVAKQVMIDMLKSNFDRGVEYVKDVWQSDCITTDQLRVLVLYATGAEDNKQANALRFAANRAGMRPLGKVWLDDGTSNVWAIRNFDLWSQASPQAIVEEVKRGAKGVKGLPAMM